jgi:response regulator RpfG family c-di-GMP phosphodiesterase
MKKPKILLMDDEAESRDFCLSILARSGYETEIVSDGFLAMEKLQEEDFDLFLLGIRMLGRSGLDLLQNLRDMSVNVPIVVLTPSDQLDKAISTLRLGVRDFLIKPFLEKEFLEAVSEAIAGGRMARERIRLQLLLPLFEISRELLLEMDLRRLLKKILAVATKETHADGAAIMLLAPGSGAASVREEIGRCSEKLWRLLAHRVLDEGHPLILVEEGSVLDQEITALMKENGISALISMPLLTKKRAIGLLNVCKKKGSGFNESDLELIAIFCGHAAIAVENVRLFEEVKRQTEEIKAAHFDSIQALAEALENKDAYTRGHSDRALEYAVAVGERTGIEPERMEHLKYAAILHDIGKIGIPDMILNKPAKLTAKEFAIIQTHPEKGAGIIRQIKYLGPVVPLVLYHQERYDGKGYPAGLKGDEIPLESRIVAVLDAYDAMTTDRIYRKALEREQALRELRRNAGTQFDPKVVDAFLEVIAEREGIRID